MKFVRTLTSAAVLLTASSLSFAVELKSDEQQFSYAMGVNLASLLSSQGITEIDAAALAAGIDDVINNKQLQLDIETMKAAIDNQRQQLEQQAKQAAESKKQQGQTFLENNKKQSGIVVLENGLQYQVIASGNGASPKASDRVKVHYHGTLTDGKVFDSSVERGDPAVFGLGQVIPGFREAITRMKVGDKWKVFVPSDLGYGESGAGSSIGPNETLIFEIELISIES